jgi:urease accessory protein
VKFQILFRPFSIALAATAFAAGPAEAHVVNAGPGGFAQGLVHPFLGIDHVLAMIAVGLWAAHLGGRARWLVPASFVSVMALAGGLGIAGLALPYVETGIALSVVALGGLIFARARLPLALGMALVGGFALFHGLAHGLEAPVAAGFGYGVGFVAATAVLHALGVGTGVLTSAKEGGLARWFTRLSGGVAIAAGLVLTVL